MALIKVSELVKEELEQLKKEGEFKSLDAVIRHYVDSSIEIVGGIFLSSTEQTTFAPFINIRNIRSSLIQNCYTDTFVTPPKTIMLYKCLKCQTTSFQKEDAPIIVPNCMGCGKGMTPITIHVGFED